MEAILSGTSPRYSRDQSEFDRAIGFVDATFALALTLLVTTLDVDHPRVAFPVSERSTTPSVSSSSASRSPSR